jgi:dTDP-4-dehydrorhamnose reductase
MRLLVLGATGQLGSDLVARARSSPSWELVPLPRALDLSRPGTVLEGLEGVEFDVLVNCAADNDTGAAEVAADRPFQVNAHAAERLAQAARAAAGRFVHVSTDYVFDGRLDRPYRETDLPAPLSVYGASKLMGESLARRAHPEGTLVVRTASLFGIAGRHTERGNFAETIIRAADDRDRLEVVDDVTMSPTYTEDLASAILRLLEADAPPDTYHVVNGGSATWFELASAIVESLALDLTLEAVAADAYSSRVRRPRFTVLDASRASEYIGPLPHWRDALRRYLDARAGAVGRSEERSRAR